MFSSLSNVVAFFLAFINIIGFILVGIDKYKARYKLWRIPERTFFALTLIGGFPGVYTALFIFRHKTRRWYFVFGMPLIFILQLLLIYWLFY